MIRKINLKGTERQIEMYKYLDSINLPTDLKKLCDTELDNLSKEIRDFLLQNVSKTGGHLASNLGVVELTLALLSVFNFPKDRIVWDVGHQSYVYKILTGRKDEFSSLRQLGGLSGFPKRYESIYDMFETGHSSTSISAALGMARARDLSGEDYQVVAVIGDGALTGGMALEALNDAGRSNTDILIVLNDNEMSISHNVGGLSLYLSQLRATPLYYKVKEDVKQKLRHVPVVGDRVTKTIEKAKESIKYLVIPGMFFEDLGYTYLGPVDGHDIVSLKKILEASKEIKSPKIVHVITKKGFGYVHAEKNPDRFHGIDPFDIKTGEVLNHHERKTFSKIFGEELVRIAERYKRVVAITAAMKDGTGLTEFSKRFPERFFDVGIAEQHAVTMAAGLATQGYVPVFAVYSTFLQRGFDQIIHDVCLQNLHVVFAVDRAGLVGRDGETHHGMFDLSYLSMIPNMTVMSPMDGRELKAMLRFAVNYDGPVAIRYPRGYTMEEGIVDDLSYGRGELITTGDDITIVCEGIMSNTVKDILDDFKAMDIHPEVINARFVKPVDKELILSSVEKTGKLLVIENNALKGGFGNEILQIIAEKNIKNVKIKLLGIPDNFITHGSPEELYKLCGLDADSIKKQVLEMVGNNEQKGKA
ncbi:MAG: 1-deoxy-D-xylulose-5-phosphate synthase [Thermoanaerobacteraceae bacterium]|nr:1-deoxy-D-xylulose-5-phosphate synthase [Thermoanaerobacteraceae bacterium]